MLPAGISFIEAHLIVSNQRVSSSYLLDKNKTAELTRLSELRPSGPRQAEDLLACSWRVLCVHTAIRLVASTASQEEGINTLDNYLVSGF